MEGFVPQKRPFFERLRGSLGIIIGGVLVLCLVLSYVYHRNSINDGDEDDVSTAKTQNYDPRAKSIPDSDSQTVQKAAPAARRSDPTQPATTGAFTSSGGTQPSPSENRAEASLVQVEFVLVTRDIMDRLSQESDSHLDVGRYSVAIVPQFKAKYDAVKNEAGFVSLASESRNLAMNQPSLVFRGGKEPKSNETIGFYVEVTPVKQSDRGTDYKISIKRSLPDIQATGEFKIASQSFEESATVPHNSAMLFAGLLPRKQQLVEGEDELYRNNILKAFLEPAFEKGDEEFLVVLNLRFNEPTN